jgi:hypothetical protein
MNITGYDIYMQCVFSLMQNRSSLSMTKMFMRYNYKTLVHEIHIQTHEKFCTVSILVYFKQTHQLAYGSHIECSHVRTHDGHLDLSNTMVITGVGFFDDTKGPVISMRFFVIHEYNVPNVELDAISDPLLSCL